MIYHRPRPGVVHAYVPDLELGPGNYRVVEMTEPLPVQPGLPAPLPEPEKTPEFEAWLAKGKSLLDQENTLHWEIGDWLIDGHGLDRCGGKSAREAFARAHRYSIITLWEKERVAERFSTKDSRRLESKLEWSYFQAAAALPTLEERLALIDRAIAEGIKLLQFRELVNGKRIRANKLAKADKQKPLQLAPLPAEIRGKLIRLAKVSGMKPEELAREFVMNAVDWVDEPAAPSPVSEE